MPAPACLARSPVQFSRSRWAAMSSLPRAARRWNSVLSAGKGMRGEVAAQEVGVAVAVVGGMQDGVDAAEDIFR